MVFFYITVVFSISSSTSILGYCWLVVIFGLIGGCFLRSSFESVCSPPNQICFYSPDIKKLVIRLKNIPNEPLHGRFLMIGDFFSILCGPAAAGNCSDWPGKVGKASWPLVLARSVHIEVTQQD